MQHAHAPPAKKRALGERCMTSKKRLRGRLAEVGLFPFCQICIAECLYSYGNDLPENWAETLPKNAKVDL